MKDVEIIGMLKSYVQKSLIGVGALKGAPCKIQSITDGDGFHTVKFEWTDDAGTSHTSDMIVNDGSDIASITQDGATITVKLSDGTSHDFIVPTVQGPKGDKGDKGDTGAGVPEGGTAGQVLVKKSSTDYDTKWDTPAGGGDMLKSVYDTDNDGKVDSAENADTVDGHTVAKDVPADAKFTDTVYDDTEIRGEIPSKTSDLTNDSGFITKAVNDLVNYYLKSETYSKTEVDDIVTAIKNSRFEVVATLPTTDIKTNVIYLVPKDPAQTSNVKNEYINLDGTTSGWEKIGDTEIDLSNYVTTQALNTALAAYTTTSDLITLLAGKQDTLTFDDAPTENSNNPVKSGGVYSTNDKIYQVMGQNSAKNFIPFDLDRIKAKNTTGTWNGNVYSVNGIDFTFNSDGTVDASGTATETASVYYYDPVGLPPFGGDRILRLTGCPSGGGSGTTYKVMAYRAGAVDGSTGTAEDYGDGISLRWLNDGSGVKAFISISVYTGAGTIDVTFKPMLRLSTDTDNTFAPYAKTNQQLTAENQTLTNKVKDYWSEGGKNKLPNNIYGTTTNNGVTVSRNDDGSLNVSGTNTASNVISISLSDAVWGSNTGGELWLIDDYLDRTQTYTMSISEPDVNVRMRMTFYDSSKQVISGAIIETRTNRSMTIPNEAVYAIVRLAISQGATVQANTVVYPMIRLASDTDDTYEPYAKTNQQLTQDTTALLDNTEVNGAVNMLDFTHASQVVKGYTFTNTDGVVTVTGSRASGETGNADHYVNITLTKGTYKVSGCPSGGSDDTWRLLVNINDGAKYAFDYGDGAVFTLTEESSLRVYCTIMANYSDTVNLTFYPMITVPSYNGDYVPYAKTNRQLTEDSVDWESNSVLGAKNFLTNKGTATTQGVEFAVDSNGVFTVTRKSAGSSHAYYSNGRFTLKPGTYIFSNGYNSLPSGIQATYLYNHTDGVYFTNCNNGPKTFTITEEKELAFNIEVQTTQSPSGVKIYPMIRLASDNDPTYQPYAKTNRELTKKIDIVGNLFTTTTKVVDNITHGIATTVATLENLPIGTYVVSGQFNSDSAMSGGGLVQFASSGVIQNGASCSTIINQGFKANAGLTGIFNVTNATNQINLQIYTANADLTVSSARLAAIRIA